jgi:hypothetical protein
VSERFVTFDRLDEDWARLIRSATAADAVRRWSHDPALAGVASLQDLLDRRAAARPPEADAILRALVTRSSQDQLAARTLLQALIPGLHRLARTAGRGSDDAAAELVGLAWDRIATYPVERRPGNVAANILLDVRKEFLQDRGHDEIPIEPGTEPVALARHVGVMIKDRGGRVDELDVIDARDALRRLLDRARLRPTTATYLWRRACGEDNATLRAELGLTEAQSWDCWRRGLAALARAS